MQLMCKCCALPTWWSWRGGCTRSHSEHGRETPQRRWYFVLRRGRVGRCQVCKTQHIDHLLIYSLRTTGRASGPFCFYAMRHTPSWHVAGSSSPSQTCKPKVCGTGKTKKRAYPGRSKFIAGWSSPVARQAHNLKVVGSNPTPATKF